MTDQQLLEEYNNKPMRFCCDCNWKGTKLDAIEHMKNTMHNNFELVTIQEYEKKD